MFHRAILIGVICTLAGLQARGARVYTAAGDTYEGTVTKARGKVFVETKSGRVVLNAKTVIHIEYPVEARPKPKPQQPATTQPATGDNDVAVGSMLLKSGAMVLGSATRPEPIIYMNMRALSASQTGTDSARIRRQIDLWRAHAHDRLRKTGSTTWLAPKDFVRRRKAFVELLGEAVKLRALSGSTRRYSSSKTPAPLTARQKRYRSEALEKTFQAARTWADPALHSFMTGVAQMQARKFPQAEKAFRLGVRQAPLLAGMHQGLGLACARQSRHLAALESFLEALRLRPDSGEALYLVRETMKQVPGRSIKSLLYRNAIKATMPYAAGTTNTRRSSPGRTSYVEWLMPGGGSRSKSWRVPETTLPTPPYDRLEYRQAVGVAVGKHAIVVDTMVVQGAQAVFVKIGNVLVPAVVGRTRYSRGKAPPPVSTVYLPDFAMTPATVPAKGKPVKAGSGVIYATGIFGQLNQDARKISCTFVPGGKKEPGSISRKLLPGDAASPVLSDDGVLVGFVAGKTSVTIKGAGVDKFISFEEISSTVRRAAAARISSSRSGYSSAKRTITPKPVEGKTFVVYSIIGELFKPGV